MGDVDKQIGAAIRGRRELLGISQRDMAAALHTSHTTISAMERGARQLLFTDILDVCEALGITLRDLTAFMNAEDIAKLGY